MGLRGLARSLNRFLAPGPEAGMKGIHIMATNRISDSNNIQNMHNQLTAQNLANGEQVFNQTKTSANNASQRQINNTVRGEQNALNADGIEEFKAQLQLQKAARQTVSVGI